MKASEYLSFTIDRLPKGYIFTYSDFDTEQNSEEAIIKLDIPEHTAPHGTFDLSKTIYTRNADKCHSGTYLHPRYTFGMMTFGDDHHAHLLILCPTDMAIAIQYE